MRHIKLFTILVFIAFLYFSFFIFPVRAQDSADTVHLPGEAENVDDLFGFWNKIDEGGRVVDQGSGIVSGGKSAENALDKAKQADILNNLPKAGPFETKIGTFNIPEKILWKFEKREFTQGDLIRTIENGRRFTYKHNSVLKTGFYDEGRGIFVATYNNAVLSIFKAKPKYIENLMKTMYE